MLAPGRGRGLIRPPRSLLLLGVLAAVLVAVVLVLQVGALTYAYRRLGLTAGWIVAILAASIVGSAVNVPLFRLSARRELREPEVITFFGARYVIGPAWTARATVVAVNAGGALVPLALATYLVLHDGLGVETVIATALVTVGVHFAARPLEGVGVVVPGLFPPLLAAGVALLVGGPAVPATAYVAGVMGCLLGADVLNLGRVRDLGAPVVSIGGAGTFDGIFLTGIAAVLIASL